MADLSKSLAEQISDLTKSIPQRDAVATVNKPKWWQFWRLKERRKAKNMEKIMNVMINRPEFQSKVSDKMREAMLHELCCGDLSHMHGAVYACWETGTKGNDLRLDNPDSEKKA